MTERTTHTTGAEGTPRTHEWGKTLWWGRLIMDPQGVYRTIVPRICTRCGRSDIAARAFEWTTCNGGPDAD